MPEFDEDTGLAPKIFFVDPDPSIVSETFLEMAFSRGFEAYSLPDNLCGDLTKKVSILVESFPDLILFFSIDRKGSIKAWSNYLRELQKKGGSRLRTGVLYSEVRSPKLDLVIRKSFNFDLGLTAGCIALQVSIRKNHEILLDVLTANQAMGRRKLIRVKCDALCRVKFGAVKAVGELVDLSLSHFSVLMENQDSEWRVGTKFSKVQLRIWGAILTVDAVLVLKRTSQGSNTCVFLFRSEEGQIELEESLRNKVSRIIFDRFQTKTKRFLEDRLGICQE